MTYTSLDEIPYNVRLCYDEGDLIKWMAEYNSAYAKIEDGTLTVPDYCKSKSMYARELAFEACKFLPSSRYLKSSCTAEVVDRQNDIADIDSYIDASPDFIDNGGIGVSRHSSKVVSMVWKAEKGIDKKTGTPNIIVSENYFRGTSIYDDTWKGVLNGELSEKSIGSRVDRNRSHMECNEQGCHNRIYAEQWFELSSVFRGANPRTYIIDKNEALKSVGNINIVEMNKSEQMCPCKKNYMDFKADCLKLDNSANIHYIGDGTMYVRTKSDCDFADVIKAHYPDADVFSEHGSGLGNITFISQRKGEYTDLDVFNELMIQVEGERGAIEGYMRAIDYMSSSKLSSEKKELIIKILNEIITDELRHVGTLMEAVECVNENIHEHLEEGEEEAEELSEKDDDKDSEKADTLGDCPPGQHRHAGIEGCHDETRAHPQIEGSAPNPKSVMSIQTMPTIQLRNMLVNITAILQQYPDDNVELFLQSEQGKKYLSMYAELMRRCKSSDKTENTMNNEEEHLESCKSEPTINQDVEMVTDDSVKEDVAKECADDAVKEEQPVADSEIVSDTEEKSDDVEKECKEDVTEGEAPSKETLKADYDLVQAIQNISATLVKLNASMDTISARLDGLENMQKIQSDAQSPMVDAVMNDVQQAVPPQSENTEMSDAKSAENTDVKPGEDGSLTSPTTEENAQPPATSEEESKPTEEEKPEEKPDFPPKKEESSSDKPEEEKKPEPKAEDKKEEPAEDKPKKEEDKTKSIDWDDINSIVGHVDAFTQRIDKLKSLGVNVSGTFGGNVISSDGVYNIKSQGNVSLVDTPAPAFDMSSMSNQKGHSMEDIINTVMSGSPKQLNDKIQEYIQ